MVDYAQKSSLPFLVVIIEVNESSGLALSESTYRCRPIATLTLRQPHPRQDQVYRIRISTANIDVRTQNPDPDFRFNDTAPENIIVTSIMYLVPSTRNNDAQSHHCDTTMDGLPAFAHRSLSLGSPTTIKRQ